MVEGIPTAYLSSGSLAPSCGLPAVGHGLVFCTKLWRCVYK